MRCYGDLDSQPLWGQMCWDVQGTDERRRRCSITVGHLESYGRRTKKIVSLLTGKTPDG